MKDGTYEYRKENRKIDEINPFDNFSSIVDVKQYIDEIYKNEENIQGTLLSKVGKDLEKDILYTAFMYVYEHCEARDKNINTVKNYLRMMITPIEDGNIPIRYKFDDIAENLSPTDAVYVVYWRTKKLVSYDWFLCLWTEAIKKI